MFSPVYMNDYLFGSLQELTCCTRIILQKKEAKYTSMGNHFHKSEIFHSWQKMYQCEPIVHLYHYENLHK